MIIIPKKVSILFVSALIIWAIMLYGQYVLQKEETSLITYEDGITRGEVLKAIALALTDKETCKTVGDNYFSEEDFIGQSAWYVPYANYLYAKGIIDMKTIVPVRYALEQNIETLELKKILYRLNMVEVADRFLQAEDGQVVLEKLWWNIYDEILDFYDKGYEVITRTIKVCGTISNVVDAKPWQVYTNQGIMGFDGIALDYYIDSEIEVLQRNGEIIRVTKLLNRDITYENVWIIESGTEEIQVFLYGIVRSFSMNLYTDIVAMKETIGDITLQNGMVVQVKEKSEYIQAKVLAVHEDSIELKNYGTIPLAEEFQVYQLYDEMKLKGVEDIMVGYANQQFVLQDGKICTALLINEAEITQIRVLLMTTGYMSYYHSNVQLIAQNDIILTQGNEIKWYPVGSTIDINADMFKDNGNHHIVVQSESEIGISSITRAQGIPYYGGKLELTLTEQGILIINELELEDYLLKVVPSEMPARYGIETAKIQAICARSFAIGQIEKNACRAYGVHVDDSTTYQVYNNISSQESSTEGVRQTEGLVLTDESTGSIISAWYYSTSCGFGTDNRSWGSATVSPYIQAREISENGVANSVSDASDTISESVIQMQHEDVLKQWITNWDVETYESDMTWFRWKYNITLEQLQIDLEQILPSVLESYGKYIFTVDEMGNERRVETIDFGTLLSVEVKSRGLGGIVQELVIYGTKQTLLIKYQTAIRKLMGNAQRTYENFSSTGNSIAGTSLLPSAFFCIVPITEEHIIQDENITEYVTTGYTIYGGGIGHGIGMSQNAAKAMCDTGMTAEEVLAFFYPGADITNTYIK